MALVDCDQRSEEVTHLSEVGEEPMKATLCRKMMQLGKKTQGLTLLLFGFKNNLTVFTCLCSTHVGCVEPPMPTAPT